MANSKSKSGDVSKKKSVAERAKFYEDWLVEEPVRAGEPKNAGSSVRAFIDTVSKLADDYEPTGVIIKIKK